MLLKSLLGLEAFFFETAIGVAARCGNLVRYGWWHLNRLDGRAEQVSKGLFPNVGVATMTPEPGAAVVDVLPLLLLRLLRRHRAATPSAPEEPHEHVLPFLVASSGLVLKNLLRPLEGVPRDQGLGGSWEP